MKLKNGMIIRCNSKEEAQEFIKEAHKQGFKWVNYVNYHEGDEEKTCWGYTCDFNSKIYYYLEADQITWSTMYSGNDSIEYSTLKEKKDIMTKSDLKNGMVVELADGSRALVINDSLVFEDGHQGLSVYKDDLTTKPFNNEMQINKVFESKLYGLCGLLKEYLTLIWEREEKEELKVGDIVIITDIEHCYDLYDSFFKQENLPIEYAARYSYGGTPSKDCEYKILHIGQHIRSKEDLALVEMCNDERLRDSIYIVKLKTLKKK